MYIHLYSGGEEKEVAAAFVLRASLWTGGVLTVLKRLTFNCTCCLVPKPSKDNIHTDIFILFYLGLTLRKFDVFLPAHASELPATEDPSFVLKKLNLSNGVSIL
jgi:hypothetical protein